MAAGMSSDADAIRLDDRLGTRWAFAETSFKFRASCRHTHPAADTLLALMHAHDLKADHVATVTALVHQGATDVLGPGLDPQTVHAVRHPGRCRVSGALDRQGRGRDPRRADLAGPHRRAEGGPGQHARPSCATPRESARCSTPDDSRRTVFFRVAPHCGALGYRYVRVVATRADTGYR